MPMQRWSNVAVAVCAVIGSLLLIEMGLRIAGFEYPRFHQPDLNVGWSLRPNRQGWWRSEGNAFVSINSHGQRDREHEFRKPPGTVRIAVLGDSFTEALQVPVERTFWSLMESLLNRCDAFSGRTVETINFGVSGYGTAQQLLQLRSRVWAFSPDIVLVALFTGNDIVNNSRRLEAASARPFFVLSEDALVQDDSFSERRSLRVSAGVAGSLYRRVSDHSRIVQLVQFARARIAIRSAARAAGAQASTPSPVPLDMNPQLYRKSTDEDWAQAWRVTGRILQAMHDETAARGVRFVVVTLSNDIQVHPDPAMRERIAKQIGVDSLFGPDEAVAALAARLGIEHVALAADMQREAERTGRFLHGFDGSGFGHWNEEGHRTAGQLVAQALCRSPR